MENISERNPHLEEMREQGWAWMLRSEFTGGYGAPTTDDEYIKNSRQREHQELLIVSWE